MANLVVLFVLLTAAGRTLANADWTATCVSGCTCKWADGKKVAECPNAGYTTIPANLSSEIQVLDLRGNPLRHLPSRAFASAGLINLQRIFLRHCGIGQVDKDAFHELNIMIEVDLSHNVLERMHPETFAGNEKLRFLTLSHNPLVKLEAHQFPSLPHLRSLDLVNSSLEMVDKKAFMHLGSLQMLKLSGNRFTNLKPEVFLPLNKLKSVDLQDNPWVCDCRLLALRDYLSEANLNSTLTLCEEPEHLKGRQWSRLAAEDFACKPLIEVSESHVEGRLGFDVTFSCRVSGNPPPTIWWVLQNRQVVNTSTASQGEQFVIRQSTHPIAPRNGTANASPVVPPHPDQPEVEHWSNLTLRRISEQDAGMYKCVARNRGGQVEANVSLQTPPAPVIILIEEDAGLTPTVWVVISVIALAVLLTALASLVVCLCRRAKRKGQLRERVENAKVNGSAKQMNGSVHSGGGGGEQEKSLLEIEMDQHNASVAANSANGYQAVCQTDVDAVQQQQRHHHHQHHHPHNHHLQQLQQLQLQQQQQQQMLAQQVHHSRLMMAGSSSAAASNYATYVDAARVILADGTQVQQNPDGSFYPDLLDIPHRSGRGGGSPSSHSGASNETAPVHSSVVMTMPLSAAHLAGHPSYGVIGHHHPPSISQYSDTVSTTSSSALLLPVAGSRPGYVTLPRRPRPRVPSWASSPPPMTSSPAPTSLVEEPREPLYDTVGPRITADGSSTSALSLNKIASLGRPPSACGTLNRGQKMSLPAYYVPIEEVEMPPASPLVHHRGLQQSTPNIMSNGQYDDVRLPNRTEPVLGYLSRNVNTSTPNRGADDSEAPLLLHDTSHNSNSTSFSNGAETLSPIVPDYRTPGSRASVSSLHSGHGTATTARRKIPPAVAPKPHANGGAAMARPASVVPYDSASSTPVKVAPKPPPKPKKKLSASDVANGGDSLAAYEDEGEDGTEV